MAKKAKLSAGAKRYQDRKAEGAGAIGAPIARPKKGRVYSGAQRTKPQGALRVNEGGGRRKSGTDIKKPGETLSGG